MSKIATTVRCTYLYELRVFMQAMCSTRNEVARNFHMRVVLKVCFILESSFLKDMTCAKSFQVIAFSTKQFRLLSYCQHLLGRLSRAREVFTHQKQKSIRCYHFAFLFPRQSKSAKFQTQNGEKLKVKQLSSFFWLFDLFLVKFKPSLAVYRRQFK